MTEPAAQPDSQILYLEPDDEIPSVVRRLEEANAERVVLVAPGRSKATSSAIGLRLLARRAGNSGRSLALVADAASRALAAEAGIPAFGSVNEAQAANGAEPVGSTASPAHGSIHVVRGEPERLSQPLSLVPDVGQPASMPRPSRLDETQAVPVVAPPAVARRPRPIARRRAPADTRAIAGGAAVVLLVLAAVVAAVLPAATVHLARAGTRVGPVSYEVTLPAGTESGSLQSTQSGPATGKYDDSTPAKGTVTFANYSSQKVDVPKGTSVSAGDLAFTTDAAVTVPKARQFGEGATANVTVTASAPGPDGNVAKWAIDTVDDPQVRADLCAEFLFCTRRLVANNAPLTGGTTKTGKQITQQDVDALVATIRSDLDQQLQSRLQQSGSDRVYAPPEQPQDAVINVPKGLVGTKNQDTFELSGTLAFDRRFVTTGQLVQAGTDQLQKDQARVGAGRELLGGTVTADPSGLRASGDQVAATIDVTGSVARHVDTQALKDLIAGKSVPDAVRALAPYGVARVDTWPGWVNAIPRLGFRIDLRLEGEATSASVNQTQAWSAWS